MNVIMEPVSVQHPLSKCFMPSVTENTLEKEDVGPSK